MNVWDDDTYNTKSMYRIDWINGMICLGYFMAGYTVIYEMILLQCLIYHITSTIGIIFSINQSMLFPIKTISQNYEHYTEW
jgi:hypothetical protein